VAWAPLYAQTAEDPALRRAIAAYDEGRLDDALDLLSAAPRTLPARDQAVRYLYEGLIRLAAGEADRARASFLRAVTLDPAIRLDPAVHSPGRLQAFEEVRDGAVAQWRSFANEAEARADTLEARRLWEGVLDALPGDAEAEAGIARLSPRPPPFLAEPVPAADSANVPAEPVVVARRYSPGQAMVLGLVVPGMGEVYTGRPLRGLLVLGAAAGAAATGLLVERVAIDCLVVPVDNFCPPDQIANERIERPYRTLGLGAAAAITVLGAIDAYFGARSQNARAAGASGARLEVPSLHLGMTDVRLELLRLRF
jgi:tetratricopeptide (TPR) repeat protein